MLAVNGKVQKLGAVSLEPSYRFRFYVSTPLEPREHKHAILWLAQSFEGASITHGIGVWKGTDEISSCIEVVASEKQATATIATFEALANAVKIAYRQEAILLTVEPIYSTIL